ncbi:VOC family protein [Ahrensia kielensis]|uniref:VOC family protein n=1 Tax=Ahrensia kielensis TaxID=76980 RepID=UPI0003622DD3|nr:VOC family protein [Ahrensia kielensis]
MPDKAKMLGTACVLLVRDFKKSVDYWENCLGFTAHIWGEPPNFAIMERDNIRIMLSHAPDHTNKPNWEVGGGIWNSYFWVDDVQSIYQEFIANGAKIDYTLHEKPYGVLEFGIQDLDGHDIAFGQDLN